MDTPVYMEQVVIQGLKEVLDSQEFLDIVAKQQIPAILVTREFLEKADIADYLVSKVRQVIRDYLDTLEMKGFPDIAVYLGSLVSQDLKERVDTTEYLATRALLVHRDLVESKVLVAILVTLDRKE